MKKSFTIALILIVTLSFSQEKAKIKGSKIVTIEQKKVDSFDAIEVLDDIEISLIKGDKNGVELEADDNLQSAIGLKMNGNTLIVYMDKVISSFKKFSVRVTYTDSFKSVVAKDNSKINVLEEMKLNEISFKCLNEAKMYLNLNSKNITIIADDKSHIETNSKSETASIILSKNSDLKALISATELKLDLYQKAKAVVEGDVIDMKLRLDNNTNFNGKKITAKNMALIAEGNSYCTVLVQKTMSIEASGTTEIQLFGEPKIDLKKFIDSATLYKKLQK